MPGPPLSADKREAIIADIRAGGKGCRQIAKDHGVGSSTVSDIAKAAGIHNAFDRTQTEKATQAHAVDCRARREALKAELLDDAERLRKRAWSPYEVVVDTRANGPQVLTLDLPPLQDARAAYTAIGIAIDKSVRLEQYDTSDSAASAKSLLGSLAEALDVAAQSLNTEEPDTE